MADPDVPMDASNGAAAAGAAAAEETKQLCALHLTTVLPAPGFTAATTRATRLAVASKSTAFVASGKQVSRIRIDAYDASSADVVASGKRSGVSEPIRVAAIGSTVLPQYAARSEIQSLAAINAVDGTTTLAVVDSRGRVLVSNPESETAPTLLAPLAPISESGWAGLAINAAAPAQLATCHSMSKFVQLFDAGAASRLIPCCAYPTDVLFVPNTSSLCVLEGQHAVIHDLRQAAEAVRLHPSAAALSCADARAETNQVVVCGNDQVAYVYDIRTWTQVSRWRVPVKFDVTSIHLSTGNTVFVTGTDHEVLAAKIVDESAPARAPKRKQEASAQAVSMLRLNFHTGFRGDSNWIGAGLIDDGHGAVTFVGATQSGTAYIATNAQYLAST